MREYMKVNRYAKCGSCRAEVALVTIRGKEQLARHRDVRGLSKRNLHMAPVCDGKTWDRSAVIERPETYGTFS